MIQPAVCERHHTNLPPDVSEADFLLGGEEKVPRQRYWQWAAVLRGLVGLNEAHSLVDLSESSFGSEERDQTSGHASKERESRSFKA